MRRKLKMKPRLIKELEKRLNIDKANSKEELLEKIKKDFKFDKLMSLASVLLFTMFLIYWYVTSSELAMDFSLLTALNLLIWLNAYLLTKRNLQMMELN